MYEITRRKCKLMALKGRKTPKKTKLLSEKRAAGNKLEN